MTEAMTPEEARAEADSTDARVNAFVGAGGFPDDRMRRTAATLRAYGIDIRTLRRTYRAQLIQNVITLFFAMTALFLGAKQYWSI